MLHETGEALCHGCATNTLRIYLPKALQPSPPLFAIPLNAANHLSVRLTIAAAWFEHRGSVFDVLVVVAIQNCRHQVCVQPPLRLRTHDLSKYPDAHVGWATSTHRSHG